MVPEKIYKIFSFYTNLSYQNNTLVRDSIRKLNMSIVVNLKRANQHQRNWRTPLPEISENSSAPRVPRLPFVTRISEARAAPSRRIKSE